MWIGPQTRFQSVIFGPSAVIFTGVLLNAALFSIRECFKEQPHKGVFVLGSATRDGREALMGRYKTQRQHDFTCSFVFYPEYLKI